MKGLGRGWDSSWDSGSVGSGRPQCSAQDSGLGTRDLELGTWDISWVTVGSTGRTKVQGWILNRIGLFAFWSPVNPNLPRKKCQGQA